MPVRRTGSTSQGASRSSTTRSNPGSSAQSATSPIRRVHPRCSPPKNSVTFRRATAAKSSRSSQETTWPVSSDRRSSAQVSAPEPAPASNTRAPGKMSPMVTIWAASFG